MIIKDSAAEFVIANSVAFIESEDNYIQIIKMIRFCINKKKIIRTN